MKKIFLRMGKVAVTDKPSLITTVLGSCVSACIWDSRRGIGGINHFKAPSVPGNRKPSEAYGEVAMKSLIDEMLRLGSRRRDMKAMLLGGGTVLPVAKGQPNIGRMNIQFARESLEKEKIQVVSSSTGLKFGRKIIFNTSDGSVSVSRISPSGAEALNGPSESD